MAADTQAIKDRIDVVQLIGEYITLKKAGANWKANCPFHNEKSPSFMVHADKQIWHCFGCGKGGDIFSFVQEMEGMDFVEALKMLAQRAGVEVSTYQSEVSTSQKNRLYEINEAAAYFFHHFLLEVAAALPAREYLSRRQLKPETISDWQIGFAPDQWELLTKYLQKKGFALEDLVAAGLTIKREGANSATGQGFYDRFRGRIMFPICDAHGSVVGFTGRVLVETENSGGKYVNTPQTLLYDKSRLLYGLHKAKTEIKAKDVAVLVEGQMDVVACHQAGMRNVVAASGTALTTEQIKLLKRYTTNLAMAFDGDAAGENAGKRGASLAVEEGMRVKVIQIPVGFAKDADECLKKDSTVWFKAVENAKSIMEWYFSTVLPKCNRNNPQSKQQAVETLLTQIIRIPFAVERDDWLKRLGEELSIDGSILREEMKKIKSNVPKTSVRAVVATVKPVNQPPQTALESLIQEFWSLIVKYPQNYGEFAVLLKKDYFQDSSFLSLYETANNLYNKDQVLNTEVLRQTAAIPGTENLVDILLLRPYKNFAEPTAQEARTDAQSIFSRIKEEWRKKRGKEIQQALSLAEKNKDTAIIKQLMEELQSL